MYNKALTLNKKARLAGFLYFILVITGVFSIMYVSSRIIVQGDTVATAGNILANEYLFRVGIINDLISNIVFIFLALTLYNLLKQVNKNQAKLMLVLVIIQIPLVFIMGAFNMTSLMMLKGELLQTFQLNQRQDLAILFLKINEYSIITLEVFWGLWLLPFGHLVFKSSFIPRVLGVFLIIAGLAYIIDSFVRILYPSYNIYFNSPTLMLAALGELSITFWLLIKGVKQ